MKASHLFYLLLFLTMGLAAWLLYNLTWGPALIMAEIILAMMALTEWIIFRRVLRSRHVTETGMDLLREQDYSSRLAPVGQRDADKIVSLFNSLMERLKAEKLHVEEQEHLLNLLINASPLGIVSLDRAGKIRLANASAHKMLGDDIIGMSLDDIPSPIARCCAGLQIGIPATLRLSDNMVYRCTRLVFMDRGISNPFYLIEILTEEVIIAEREAYGRVIRTLGHEVNNSMASISSLLSLLLEIRPWGNDDTELTETVEACAARAAGLSDFISSYSRVVKIPEIRKEPVSLNSFVSSLRPFIASMAATRGITLVTETLEPSDTPIGLDSPLMEQAIINIVKNAIESIADRPGGLITVSTTGNNRLTVTDNGAGILPEASGRLFTPFFSTKPSGQGLGLMFVSEILRRHGATFSLSTSPDDGLTRFSIRFKR